MAIKRFAVLLSGCGFMDGAEITESVSSLIALGQTGSEYQCFSMDLDAAVTNHKSQSTGDTQRNILVESARICRGNVLPLNQLDSETFDGLLIPGGFGVALHFCDWASKGHKGSVKKPIEKIIMEFYKAQKPIGAICIAPALIGLVLGNEGVTMTLGDDKATGEELEKTGAVHVNCKLDDYVTDRAHRIISTPAFMYDEALPHQAFKGISGLVSELVEIA